MELFLGKGGWTQKKSLV